MTELEQERLTEADVSQMQVNAAEAANMLKSLGHEGRLMLLCHLVTGEKTVGDLAQRLGCRQAAVSQQLSRLRMDGLVTPRREGQTIWYSLADNRTQLVLELLHDIYCDSV